MMIGGRPAKRLTRKQLEDKLQRDLMDLALEGNLLARDEKMVDTQAKMNKNIRERNEKLVDNIKSNIGAVRLFGTQQTKRASMKELKEITSLLDAMHVNIRKRFKDTYEQYQQFFLAYVSCLNDNQSCDEKLSLEFSQQANPRVRAEYESLCEQVRTASETFEYLARIERERARIRKHNTLEEYMDETLKGLSEEIRALRAVSRERIEETLVCAQENNKQRRRASRLAHDIRTLEEQPPEENAILHEVHAENKRLQGELQGLCEQKRQLAEQTRELQRVVDEEKKYELERKKTERVLMANINALKVQLADEKENDKQDEELREHVRMLNERLAHAWKENHKYENEARALRFVEQEAAAVTCENNAMLKMISRMMSGQ